MLAIRMKTTLLLLLTVLYALTLGGCALMSQEDRDFYGKGWVNPRELDDTAPKMPAHPETTGGLGKTQVVDPILDE